ncbi:hypothetical protein APHAL10511_002551 [Amanita phalloides]|nr:hypothetical protein APHAL10511_002551 [Amanita phalloides]
MSSALRRTKARALTITRSIASAFKSTIGHSQHRNQANDVRDLTISRPKRLKRPPPPAFARTHLISLLPCELLALVFVLGAESDPMLPITISHVCRTWRRLALRTPALWRRVTLDSRLGMWNERIQRAKACPLEVQLVPWFIHDSRRSRHDRRDMAAVQWYMHVVTPHIRRWRSLEIVFSDYSPYLWNAALSACCSTRKDVQALLLEELTLIYRNNDDTKEFFLFSNCAPCLKRVTLDGIKLTWTPSLFGNLIYLDYTHHGFTRGYSAAREVLDMIRVCPRLVELRLLFLHKRPIRRRSLSERLNLPLVALNRLVNLQLRVEGRDIPFELMQTATLLHTPALQQLHLVDVNERSHIFPSIKVFFRRYTIPRTLRVLFVGCGWYDGHALSPIIHASSFITHVVLQRPMMSPQLVQVMEIR